MSKPVIRTLSPPIPVGMPRQTNAERFLPKMTPKETAETWAASIREVIQGAYTRLIVVPHGGDLSDAMAVWPIRQPEAGAQRHDGLPDSGGTS